MNKPKRHNELPKQPDWSGSPYPEDPDNYWVDDKTGELVDARSGERTEAE